jgi:D-lactate dehydrogenase (cytochrome)
MTLPTIALTSLIAGGTGYWLASKGEPKTPVIQKRTTMPTQQTLRKAFKELQTILSPEHVTVDEQILREHGYSDNSYHDEGAPNIVVFPSNTEQVAEIVKIADKYSLPIIPFSGGTSLEGHFTAPRGGICISFTEHMDRIIAFHPDDLDIVVQPGVQWEDLNLFLKEHSLFFPMDPGPG